MEVTWLEVSGTQSHLGLSLVRMLQPPSVSSVGGSADEASGGVQPWEQWPQPHFPEGQVQEQSQAGWDRNLNSDTHLLGILGLMA